MVGRMEKPLKRKQGNERTARYTVGTPLGTRLSACSACLSLSLVSGGAGNDAYCVRSRADAWQLRRLDAGRMRGQRGGCGGNGRSHAGALRGCCPITQSPGSRPNPAAHGVRESRFPASALGAQRGGTNGPISNARSPMTPSRPSHRVAEALPKCFAARRVQSRSAAGS